VRRKLGTSKADLIRNYLEISKYLIKQRGSLQSLNDRDFIIIKRSYLRKLVEKENEEELFELIKKAPANTSSSYGKPFLETFKGANYNFYDIDPGLFAPAKYTITNIITGKSITIGKVNHELLRESYGLS